MDVPLISRRRPRAVTLLMAVCLTATAAAPAVPQGAQADVGPSNNSGSDHPATFNFDPRDLVSFTNTGTAQTMVTFESYQQLRDYSDLSVVATVKSVDVVRSFEAPHTSSGELHIGLNVDAVLGGRLAGFSANDELTISLPMDAPVDLVPDMLQRLQALVGQARYVLFLQQVPPYDEGVRFRPVLYGAPPAILAEWPEDGRLTELVAHDYLTREAIERGEELTGTGYPPTTEWQPTFRGSAPIGLTVDGAIKQFSGSPGHPEGEPPAGWDRLEPLLVDA